MLQEKADSFMGKVVIHFTNVWNQFDFFLLTFSVFNFILKNFKVTFWVSKLIITSLLVFYFY